MYTLEGAPYHLRVPDALSLDVCLDLRVEAVTQPLDPQAGVHPCLLVVAPEDRQQALVPPSEASRVLGRTNDQRFQLLVPHCVGPHHHSDPCLIRLEPIGSAAGQHRSTRQGHEQRDTSWSGDADQAHRTGASRASRAGAHILTAPPPHNYHATPLTPSPYSHRSWKPRSCQAACGRRGQSRPR